MRLIIALPNFVARRHAALDLCGQKLGSGLRHAVAGIHGRAGRTLGRLSDAPLHALLRETRARLAGTAARLDRSRRWRCCNAATRWCPIPPAIR